MSSAGDVIVQLYHHCMLCIDVVVNWLLTNLLVYVSTDLFCHFYVCTGEHPFAYNQCLFGAVFHQML